METSVQREQDDLKPVASSDLRPVTSGSKLAASYQAAADFTAGALGKLNS